MLNNNVEMLRAKTYVYYFNCCLFQVEAGDVILKVNETDVNRLNTKEG